MPTINYRDAEGTVTAVDVEQGSLMQAAVRNDIAGIEGECGGEMSCGTCHVYIGGAWKDKIGEASYDERDLLEMVQDLRPESRLACQVQVTADLDGLVVDLPDNSY